MAELTSAALNEADAESDFWIEEVDEVMFQPTEIVPNNERCYKSASELQKQIERRLRVAG